MRGGAATPAGIATVTVDGVVVGTAPVVNGVATLQLGNSTPLGLHVMRAQYSGAPSINGSTSQPLPLIVRR